MTVHEWAEIGGSFLVRPVMRRVRLATALVAIMVMGFLVPCIVWAPGAIPFVVAVLVPWIPLTYVRHRYRRARLSVGNSIKIESSTWAGAGRWVVQAECDIASVQELGYYQSGGRTTRIVIARKDLPGITAVDIELSDEDAESLAEAIASRLSVPVKEYSKRDLLAAT